MSFAFDFPFPDALPRPIFTKALLGHGRVANRIQSLHILTELARLPPVMRRRVIATMPPHAVRALAEEWWWQVHGGQDEPEACGDGSPWLVWAIVAGRGFGKTRAGSEWVWARAREDGSARIALVAATIDEVERVMVEGESGILACAREHERARWIAAKGVLLFPSGARAHAFSAERPDKLRGPQHHYAWCDELAKWPASRGRGGGTGSSKAEATWDNLMLGLRLGERPRAIVTTTPRPVPLLRRVLDLPGCAATHGRTAENPHLPADFRRAVESMFGGTRLGRQELEGMLLEEFEGALWSRELIEKARDIPLPGREGIEPAAHRMLRIRASAYGMPPACRAPAPPGQGCERPGDVRTGSMVGPPQAAETPRPQSLAALAYPPPAPPFQGGEYERVVVGVDPPASSHGDSCGIVVCARDREGVCRVVADHSAPGLSPEAWARRVCEAARLHGAGRVVAEKNQGGEMIASSLRAVDADLPVELVHAGPSKAARAEPIALRFETGRARLAGHFPELEDQLCALTWAGYQGAGSPDRADAMVWAMTELFDKVRPEPRIRRL